MRRFSNHRTASRSAGGTRPAGEGGSGGDDRAGALDRLGRLLRLPRPAGPSGVPRPLLLPLFLVLPLLPACGSDAAGSADAAVRTAASRDTVLERLAREVIPEVERSAGLRFRHSPRLARSPREKLESFLMSELEEQLPPERARALTAAYARLGLLPDTLQLRPLLRSLYLEQVVGYYDPGGDTLFVRENVGPGALRSVLVHEMVHALQDQHTDLDSVMEARSLANDAGTAAQAAIEGHATYVMMEWQLSRTTGRSVDLRELPDIGGMLAGRDLAGAAGMPALAGAPRVIRESLLFPYTGGLAFVQQVWRARADRRAPIGADLPSSTEQVLHVERYLADERDRPADPVFPASPREPWSEVHTDGLGEFETRLFLEAFLADTSRARRAAAGWDGDRYRLLRSRDGAEALVWTSVWDGGEEAAAFAAAARAAFRARYGAASPRGEDGRDRPGDASAPSADAVTPERRVSVRRVSWEGRAGVLVVDRPRGVELPDRALRVRLDETGRDRWTAAAAEGGS